MKLAIIPARGGSKRLPEKNLKPFLGRSLVQRTAQTLVDTKLFDRVIVSTDDHGIACEGRLGGAEVPFMRPPALATDSASTLDVVIHAALQLIDEENLEHSVIGVFQPTSPMLRSEHVEAALALMSSQNFTSLSSMCRVDQYPEWTFSQKDDSGRVVPSFPDKFDLPSQVIEPSYIENGAIYLVCADFLVQHKSLYCMQNHGMYLMSSRDSVDIDTAEDWEFAEYLLNKISDS